MGLQLRFFQSGSQLRTRLTDKVNLHSKLYRTHARRAARTQRRTKTPASHYDLPP